MSRLLGLLPPYERSSKVFEEIMQAEEKQFDKLRIDIQDLEKQLFIDSATWGLAIYEKELGLPIRPNKNLENRRSIIKAKLRGTGKASASLIKSIVEAHTRSPVEVIFDGRINISFCDNQAISINLEDVYNSVEEFKPAHLGFNIALDYKQKESEIYVGMCLLAGEEVTVYPYSPKNIESRGKVYIAAGHDTGLESTTIYPRKDVI